MKSITRYIPLVGLMLAMMGVASSCQDDFDGREPAFEAPVAEHQANMSILDLKKMYWHESATIDNESLNYCDTIGFMPGTENEHIYISGRVISNDADGNVFKSLIIQDKTAALAISINQYDLYLQYRPGQEIVIDVTGMYIGKYRGLMQLGLPKFDESRGVYAASFMPVEFFRMHAELNGFPEPEKIDTITFNNFDEFSSASNPDVLMKYQSQLVRFNNVYFQNANGKEVFSQYKSSGVDQPIVDANGMTLPVRTSGYSTFWNVPLPQNNGDVVALLSYYASSESNATFQLLLNSVDDCMNFGNPTVPKGLSADNPYSLAEAINIEAAGTYTNAWVTGYIVGAVKPEVESTISGSDDIEWTADVTLANTIVLAPTPDTRDIAACMIVPLPQGSTLREWANLVDHPDNYGKQMWIKGIFEQYMGSWGITSSGLATDFVIDGVDVPGGGPAADGDGTEANPFTVEQVIAKNPSSTTEAVASGVWVEGYIVGFIPTGGTSTVLSGTSFSATGAIASNLVIASSPDCTDYTKCIAIQLTSGSDIRKAINLMDNPGMLHAHVSLQGDIMKYCGGPGLKNLTDYRVLSSVTPDNPDNPDNPATGLGSESAPISVAQAVAAYNDGTTGEAWVEGYIVGYFSGSSADTAVFGVDGATGTNLILGPDANASNRDNCLAIQLPAGDIRNALNLMNNPTNYLKHVKLKGSLEKYFGGAALKSTSVYAFY